MPEPESVRRAYERVEPVINEVARYVRDTLEPYCHSQNYLFFDRPKTAASLAEKLEGGRLKRWSEIDDLYACTIVVPVATGHKDSVVRKLQRSFRTVRTKSRADTLKAPDVFRFDGLRWYGRVAENSGGERQPGFEDMLFEVQVVTAFEYAWGVVTHDLVYKADNADWRHQRMAAQLKAAVEQLEVLVAAFESASVAVEPSPWPETEVKAEIIERFKTLRADGLVPASLVPSSWRRFADNVYSLVSSYEDNRHKVASSVRRLLDSVDHDLRKATPFELPHSGTLFQYVVSVVARTDTDGTADRFVVVPSLELTGLYAVNSTGTAFVFDGAVADIGPTLAQDQLIPDADQPAPGN